MTVRASEAGCLQGRSRRSRSGRTELEPVSDAFGVTEWRSGAMPGGRRFFRTFSFSASAECVPFVFGSSSGNRVPVPTGARIIIYYIRCPHVAEWTVRTKSVVVFPEPAGARSSVRMRKTSLSETSFRPVRGGAFVRDVCPDRGCLPCSEPLREAVPASLRRFRSAPDGVSAGRIGRYPCRVICVLHEGERKPRPSWYVCLPLILRPDGMWRRSRDIKGVAFPYGMTVGRSARVRPEPAVPRNPTGERPVSRAVAPHRVGAMAGNEKERQLFMLSLFCRARDCPVRPDSSASGPCVRRREKTRRTGSGFSGRLA